MRARLFGAFVAFVFVIGFGVFNTASAEKAPMTVDGATTVDVKQAEALFNDGAAFVDPAANRITIAVISPGHSISMLPESRPFCPRIALRKPSAEKMQKSFSIATASIACAAPKPAPRLWAGALRTSTSSVPVSRPGRTQDCPSNN